MVSGGIPHRSKTWKGSLSCSSVTRTTLRVTRSERDEVLEVAARVKEAGAVLVVDEAFADFVPGSSVTAMVDGRLWVARSLTKFFAIPGLRLGCLVCDDARRVQALQPSWPVNAVAAAAGIAAVSDLRFAEASVAEVDRLRKDLFGALDALSGLQPFPRRRELPARPRA